MRNDYAKFSRKEQAEIDHLAKDFAPEYRMIAAAFLEETDFDVSDARGRLRKLVDRMSQSPSSVEDYLPYIGYDGDVPKPCGVLLEDGRGDCARDLDGCPICVCYGMFDCDTPSGIKQMIYLLERVSRYVAPDDIPRITYVFDMVPRSGLHSMKPNMEFFNFCMLFPQTFKFYMCGVSPPVRAAWRAASLLMPSWVRDNYVLSDTYDVLHKVISPQNMLPRWSEKGSFQFDVDDYARYVRGTA